MDAHYYNDVATVVQKAAGQWIPFDVLGDIAEALYKAGYRQQAWSCPAHGDDCPKNGMDVDCV